MRLGLVLVALLVAPMAIAAPSLSASVASSEERPWWELSLQDLDRDGVDDALPRLGSDPLVVLVAFADVPGPEDLVALREAGYTIVDWYENFDVVAVRALPTQIAGLLDVPGVVFVERDDVIYPLLKESVPLLGVPQVRQTYKVTGAGITVAVLDDGAFEQHPDFQGKLAGSFDAGAPGVPGPVDLGAAQLPVTPAGTDGHGTHVAGTIAGRGTQSNRQYEGVAPGALFANVKVFTSANSTSSTIVLEGLDWTLINAEPLGIRVASMSLGGSPSDGRDALSRAVNKAVEQGMIVVAAAGNAGPDAMTIGSPGAADQAITVGSVDKRKQLAPYSSRGPTKDGRLKPEVLAPGTAIVSTVPPASSTVATGILRPGSNTQSAFYGQLSGTSMAAPHVSGVIALMLEVNPDLTPLEVKQILIATAQDLGAPGRDNETGYGFVNAIAAAQVAENPTLLSSPQFASIISTLPPPQQAPWYEDMQYEVDELIRSGKLPVYGGFAAAALALLIFGYVIGSRRRR